MHGFDAMKKRWKEHYRYYLFVAVVWWACLFFWQLFYRVPHDIQEEAEIANPPNLPFRPPSPYNFIIPGTNAEQSRAQFTNFIFRPLKVGSKVVVEIHLINKSSHSLSVAGVYHFYGPVANKEDALERKEQEEKMWRYLISEPVRGHLVNMSVPPNVDVYVKAENDRPLSEEELKVVQSGSVLYVMGWERYAGNRRLNFCVFAQYVNGIDRSPEVRYCVRHN